MVVNNYTAVFTLSLDCEGLWGMADNDKVVSAGVINSASLSDAYGEIVATLGQYNLKATAAFVSCFAVERDLLFAYRSILRDAAEFNPIWFKHIIAALDAGTMEGWSGHKFYEQMRDAGHEIAWHGTTHQPLDGSVSSESIALELELTSELFQQLGQTPGSIIFPRNQVGHLDALGGYGFKSYRQKKPESGFGRISNLLVEFNAFDHGSAELPSMRDGWLVSPAGHFLNWPSGARSLVPVTLTVQRWKSMLKHAVETGCYVHMWFHPHNLINSPAMVQSFREIMAYAGELVRTGDMLSLTMEEANDHFIKDKC